MNKIFEKEFHSGNFIVYDDKPKHLNLVQVHQTHSKIVISQDNLIGETQKADGIIYKISDLKDNDLAIAIKTADCLPILYLNDQKVALVHAGWRGIEQKIHLHPDLIKMSPTEIFIGPCIGPEAFEIQNDFTPFFPQSPHFIHKNGKMYFDLVSETHEQLKAAFPDIKITKSGICTFKNNQYNSYRLNKTEKRNWNLFKTRG